ncbi:N-formylglutamate amidohydrolase [Ruegeria sp.]|uniref:N-formylglutamate amidohydrolase n=1 Tax=Ruegeria sp. TaxID=1879320 RepID=UPI00231D2123|nr:N-formylglutamate amidohydrolase [Ruegeria sp.]MDA7965226.1 N-formylglutamate amidohydrolase [Ruegeria sp.]
MTAPVEILNPTGKGRVVVLCEHASNRIPDEYDGLGLAEADRTSHAAWDPGARALSLALSRALDAPVVASTVSRLVYDCNRPPEAASAMPEKSELIAVPGNVGLTQAQRDARTAAVYDPFCAAVARVLDTRGPDTVVVTVHSFTPVYYGKLRAVELGLLHDDDSRLVDAMLNHVDRIPHRRTERNQPYGPADGVTHSLRLHALSRGLANVMIEVRNDLMRTDEQVATMATDILALLEPALKDITIREGAS